MNTLDWGRPAARTFGLIALLLAFVAACASSVSTATPVPTSTAAFQPAGSADGSQPAASVPAVDTTIETGWKVWQAAPDFTVTALDGEPVSQAEIAAQGKPYILYFFATW